MSTVELFGKRIDVRDKDCIFYNEPQKDFPKDSINLYILATNICNADCQFCEYHDKPNDSKCNKPKAFNYSKLKEILAEIGKNLSIRKLNITGGEPMLDMDNFDRIFQLCIDGVKGYKPEVTINTNGVRLMELLNYISHIDSIGLSGHHFNDSVNEKVFNCGGLPTLKNISDFQSKSPNKYILHARCNLIRGYIDSTAKIQKYLDTLAESGIVWAGFVTLMPLNQWCKDNVALDSNLINETDKFRVNQLWTRVEQEKEVCRCADYLYVTQSGKIITFYNRIFCNSDLRAGQLVFDGQHLRLGFGGEIIY